MPDGGSVILLIVDFPPIEWLIFRVSTQDDTEVDFILFESLWAVFSSCKLLPGWNGNRNTAPKSSDIRIYPDTVWQFNRAIILSGFTTVLG